MKISCWKIPSAFVLGFAATLASAQTAPTAATAPAADTVAPATSATTATPAATASTATAPTPARSTSNVHPISKNIIERLINSPRHVDIEKIKQGDRIVSTYVIYPSAKEKVGAVVLIHEIYGLSDWMRAAGDQLAEAGYIVLVPDLLSGLGPNKGGTMDLPETQVVPSVQGLPGDQVMADLTAVVNFAKTIPSCNGNIAVGGFCWGGGKAFAFTTINKDIKAAFVFYGAPMLPVAEMPKVNVPVYGFYGDLDRGLANAVPAEQTAMKAAGKSYDAVVYPGAQHGFMRVGQMDDSSAANKAAAEDGWKRMLAALAKINAPAAKPADAPANPVDTATKPAS